jgi:hypothetical protein
MGNWIITIQGVGSHGNGKEHDAEQIYRRFIEELRAAGQSVHHSSIHMSGAYFDPKTIPPVGWKDDK